MEYINNFGILASVSWNCNDWADELTEQDIEASQFGNVKEEEYAHESLNFGHEIFPLEKDDKYIAYTPKFSTLPSENNSKNVDVVIFISTDYGDNNKKKIIGCYGFPEIGRFERKSKHKKYHTYSGGNIRSYVENIIYFTEKLVIDEDFIIKHELLPEGKELSNQGFNYLNSNNVFKILKLVLDQNPKNDKLRYLIKKLNKAKRMLQQSISPIYGASSVIKDLSANSEKEIEELEKRMKDETPEVKERVSKYIERGTISKKIKKLTNFKCLLCEKIGVSPYSFEKKNGEYYVETHHVEPVSNMKKGSLGILNLITVCPNHHRQLHYGNSEVIENTGKYFIFNIDGKEIKIEKVKF